MRNQHLRQFVGSKWPFLGLSLAALVLIGAELRAQGYGSDVYRVEEDWVLVVNQPSTSNDGPQLTCTISPANMQTAFCAFDINYHTQPDYSAGGLQLHTWDPNDPVEVANSLRTGMLQVAGETVSWTQTMTWSGGAITFAVVNGQSQSWGAFGGANDLLTLNLPTTLSNLNGYDPNVSINNSGVSFASNLVSSLTLTKVRLYDVNGNLITTLTP